LRKGNLKDKPVSIFGSMNAECDAAQNLRQRLQQLGTAPVDRGFMIPGKPAERDLRNAYEYGYNFRCIIEKKTNTRRAHLVKCLVCGEIFDSSLGVCPVCGADLSFCVPVDEDEITFQKPTLLNYLILGGGVAAVNAADAIRLRDSSAGIVMISAEPHLPINRPMLTKNMEVLEDPDTLLLIHDRKWYDDRKIRTILGVRAIQIDTERKEVILSDDRIFSYDKLIYAVGSESFIPPFSGADQKGVITIRHIPDAVLLQKKLMTAQNVVVIGGGVLGLEAAYQIYRTGVHLTVLEATPQFVGRQVDEKTAGLIQSKMESMGVVCRTAVKIAAIEGSGQVTGVRLDDGTVFPADIVVISCGSHASVELAKAAGLAVDRAVVVDKTMQTSINGIYACGDCAQYNGISYQLWSEAAEQGKTAGANAAGDYVEYPGVPAGLSMEAFTISLFSIGDVGKKAGLTYKKVEISDEITGRHECYWFSENILRGAAVIGSPDKTGDIQNAVMTHKHYQESGTLI
jgi:NAD(P)H-nitrite reductase large subunit